MLIVVTRVKLKPNTSQLCAELFETSNPALVQDEPDWLGAQMIFDPETDFVTVMATWRDLDSYKRLSSSKVFGDTMKQFGRFFASAPEISTNTVLVDMKP